MSLPPDRVERADFSPPRWCDCGAPWEYLEGGGRVRTHAETCCCVVGPSVVEVGPAVTIPLPARLDADRTAKPLTRIIHHPTPGKLAGPGMPLVDPELEVVASGDRTPLGPRRRDWHCRACHSFGYSARAECGICGAPVFDEKPDAEDQVPGRGPPPLDLEDAERRLRSSDMGHAVLALQLLAELREARLLSAIEASGTQRALAIMEAASTVTQELGLALQAETERANKAEAGLAGEKIRTAKLMAEVRDLCPHHVWMDSLPGFCSRCGIVDDDLRKINERA